MPTALTRVREHAGWFATLLLTAALVAGLAAGIAGYLDRQAETGVRAGFGERSGAYLALRLGLPLAADAAEQDAQVRAMIERRFAAVSVPVAVDRTLQGQATATDARGIAHGVMVLSLDDAETRLELVAGDWPDVDGVLVQADAAAELGVAPGDPLTIEGTAYTVAGTWRASDRLDPRWLGDPLVETGRLGAAVGPVVVPEATWSAWSDVTPQVRWTLVPELTAAGVDDLAGFASAWRTIHRGWEGDRDGLRSLAKSGRLLQTVHDLEAGIAGFRAVEPVALLLLGAIALVTFLELARLLTTLRAAETALLWSRGASALGIAGRTAVETAITALVGSTIGVAGAVGILLLLPGGGEPPLASLAAPVLATSAVATAAVALSTARSALRQTARDPSDAAGRRRRVTSVGALALVVAAAALSVWQLRLYGSPITPTADGGSDVDPVAAPAPALTLVAVALGALALFPLVARLDERLAARGGVRRLLATRSVARRPALAAAPVLVVTLGVGSLVTAAGYQATWTPAFELAGELRAGADLHVSSDAPGIPADALDGLQALPGVTGIAPLELQDLQFGTGSGTIVAVAPDALAAVAAPFPGAFDPVATADALRLVSPGPVVPPGSRELGLTVETELFEVPAQFDAILRDSYGVLRVVPLATVATTVDADDPTRAQTVYAGELPAVLDGLAAEVRVVALDARLPAEAVTGSATGSLSVRALTATADGAPVDLPLDPVWFPDSPVPTSYPPSPTDDARGFRVVSATERARLTATLDGTFGDVVKAPVVVSQALADAYDVEVGDDLTFSVGGITQQLDVVVAGIVPVVPTSPTAVALLIDLGVLQHYSLRLTERQPGATDLWISSDDPATTAAAVREALPANTRLETAADPAARDFLGSATTALWLAAAGCAVLAVAGVAAAGRSLRRERRRGIAILRALGLGPRDQAGIRTRELGAVVGFGAVAGLVAGAAVVLLTIPAVARAAVPGLDPGLATPPGVELVPLAIALGALAVALLAVVVAARIEVVREARTASPSEEAR